MCDYKSGALPTELSRHLPVPITDKAGGRQIPALQRNCPERAHAWSRLRVRNLKPSARVLSERRMETLMGQRLWTVALCLIVLTGLASANSVVTYHNSDLR